MFYLVLLGLCLLRFTNIFGEVLELNDNNFDTRLGEYDTSLIMFYAPWCKHSKKLKPEYVKAAEELRRNDHCIGLIKIDCMEAGKKICNRFNISGYPTLKIFYKGQFIKEYNGPREALGIIYYMKAHMGPSSKELKSITDFTEFLSEDMKVRIVGFFENQSDKEAFLKTADELKYKFSFAHSDSKHLLEHEEIEDGIVLFRPKYLKNIFEESSIKYIGNSDWRSIKTFINNNFHGLVGHRKKYNVKDFKKPLVIVYFNVDYVRNSKITNYWRNRILKVAMEFHERSTFSISDKFEFKNELKKFGIDDLMTDKPIVCARNNNNQKYFLKDDFSIESLTNFVNDFLTGSLEPYLKSQPIPKSNDDPVKIIVADNFKELILENSKDVLIQFYAPWCRYCQELVPIYNELAKMMINEDIYISKMDATVNDIPIPFEVKAFPTLYWVPKNSKSALIKYEEGRELVEFLKFIVKHSTNGLKGFDKYGTPQGEKTEL